MNPWPAITTDAVRVRLSPRIGPSLALSGPWSASTPLLAYWVVSWWAAANSSTIRPGQSRRLICGHLRRFAVRTDRQPEEPGGRLHRVWWRSSRR